MIGAREIDGFEALTITDPSGELEAAFVPEAGMVCCSLLHRAEQVLGQRHGLRGYVEDHSTMGIPLLYPWANRLGAERFELAGRTVDLEGESRWIKRDGSGLPIHGLLTASAGWEVERHQGGADGGGLTAGFDWGSDPELLERFPFAHRLRLDAWIASGALSVELTVIASAGNPVPLAFGFHPYLALPGVPRPDWRLELPLGEHLLLDERGLPNGERGAAPIERGALAGRRFDDLYRAAAPGTPLALSGGGRRIELTMDARYPYTQLFAPPGEELLAIEPMTAATDALAQGAARLLEPGASFTAGFAIAVSGRPGAGS